MNYSKSQKTMLTKLSNRQIRELSKKGNKIEHAEELNKLKFEKNNYYKDTKAESKIKLRTRYDSNKIYKN